MILLPPGAMQQRNEAARNGLLEKMFQHLQGGLNQTQVDRLMAGNNPGGFGGDFKNYGLSNAQQRLIAQLYQAGAFGQEGGMPSQLFGSLVKGYGMQQGPQQRDPLPGQPGAFPVPHPGNGGRPPLPPFPGFQHGDHGNPQIRRLPVQHPHLQGNPVSPFQMFQQQGRPNFRQMFLQRAMQMRGPMAR